MQSIITKSSLLAIIAVLNSALALHSTLLASPTCFYLVSGWSRFREYFSLFVIVTGVVYGLYSLYKVRIGYAV